jgi:hypothetical protein
VGVAERKRRGPVLGAVGAVDHQLRQHQRADRGLVFDRAGDANDDHPLDIDRVEQLDGRGAGQGTPHPGDHRDQLTVTDPPRIADSTSAESQPPSQRAKLDWHGADERDHGALVLWL